MAAALKFVVQKGVNDLAGKAGADNAAAHAQGIGIVVAAGVLGAERLRAAAGADALHLVGAHRHAYAGAAAQDDQCAAAVLHGLAALGGKVRVVHAGGGIGAKVGVGYAQLVQMGLDGLLQLIAAVVGSKCNRFVKLHFVSPLFFHVPRAPARPGSNGGSQAAGRQAAHTRRAPK